MTQANILSWVTTGGKATKQLDVEPSLSETHPAASSSEPSLRYFDLIPDEVLLSIAEYIQVTSNANDKNILSFCKVDRRSRAIGQEVLYTSPTVRLSRNAEYWDPGDYEADEWDPSSITSFLRTLIARPDLAAFVRNLSIKVFRQWFTHTNKCEYIYQPCKGECWCHWKSLLPPVVGHIEGQDYNNLKWLQDLKGGFRPAFAGLAIATCPNLQHLGIELLAGSEHRCDNDVYEYIFWKRNYFQIREWFGSPKKFSSSVIPGLVNLSSLRFEGLLPWPMFCLSNLKSVHFALQNDRYNNVPPTIMDLSDGLVSPVNVLTITMDTRLLTSRKTSFHTYISNLTRRFAALHTVQIRLQSHSSHWDDSHWHTESYANLVDFVSSHSVVTLVIDGVDVDRGCLKDFAPMTSLSHLPRLRRVVAPQEAYFGVRDDFPQCVLPHDIEAIEVIGSTAALERWLMEGILYKKDDMPSLKRITIWRDRHSLPWKDVEDERLNEPVTSEDEYEDGIYDDETDSDDDPDEEEKMVSPNDELQSDGVHNDTNTGTGIVSVTRELTWREKFAPSRYMDSELWDPSDFTRAGIELKEKVQKSAMVRCLMLEMI